MDIHQLFQTYQKHNVIKAGRKILADSDTNIHLGGLYGSTRALAIASLFSDSKKSFIIVEDDEESAGYLYNDLSRLLNNESVYFFPPSFRRSLKYGKNDSGNMILRTEVLNALQQGSDCIIVTFPEGLVEKVMPRETLSNNTLEITKGEHVDNAFVIELLTTFGFEKVDYV